VHDLFEQPDHALIRMNHDVHRFIVVLEPICRPIVFHQLHAAQADVAIDHGERDRLQAVAAARSADTKSGLDLERCAMAAAFEKGPVGREELPRADVEPDSVMRTVIT
jgi:hypothetical protein